MAPRKPGQLQTGLMPVRHRCFGRFTIVLFILLAFPMLLFLALSRAPAVEVDTEGPRSADPSSPSAVSAGASGISNPESELPHELPTPDAGKTTLSERVSRVVDHLVSGTRHSAYEFEMTLIDGSKAPLSAYQGQVSLIVNVASKCSYTDVHYRQLEHLYNKYKDQGFTVLAFPSNDFGNQEPGSPQEIEQFVRKTKGATFPLFGKVAVNGKDADPFFEFLKDKFGIKAIPWNFQKFLVDRDGQPVRQYPSQIEPLSLEADIKQLIAVAKPSS